MDSFLREIRLGARALARKPGFALSAVVTLALGIGANTAIFSVVDAVMIRPLPFPEPERLVRLWESNLARGWPQFSVSAPNFLDWRERSRAFEDLAAWRSMSFTLTGDDEAELVSGGAASASVLPMLGATPAIGRLLLEQEDRPGGGAPVVLLSHGFWQRRFGGDPGVLGRRLVLNGAAHEVVGVLAEGFQWVWSHDLVVPLGPLMDQSRGNHVLAVVGRLAPGVPQRQAQAEMEAIARALGAAHPETNAGWGVVLAGFDDWIVGPQVGRALMVLLVAVGLVLLVACVNVAHLLLTRTAERRREIAVRLALGAGRLRLARLVLAESALLALAGGALGTLLAFWGVDALRSLGPDGVPRFDEARLDGRVLAFTLLLSVLTSLLFGILPALKAARQDLDQALRSSTRAAAGGTASARLGTLLGASQVAMAVTLLVGTGLLLRSFWRLQSVETGFRGEEVVTLRINLPASKFEGQAATAAFYEDLIGRLEAMPGVAAAGATSTVPFGGGNTAIEVILEGRSAAPDGAAPSADWRKITPGYFAAMGIPIKRGRPLQEGDGEASPSVVVVDETMARQYWPGEDPLGMRLTVPGMAGRWWTVVGVAGDVRHSSLDEQKRPTMYLAFYQGGWNPMTVVVRAAGDPSNLLPEIRSVAGSIDADVPVSALRLMDDLVSSSMAPRRFNLLLLSIFAAVAVALAAVGVYGVMAYSVSLRIQEFGVRAAMGAARNDILRLVMAQGASLLALGLSAGIAASLALTSALRSLLFGVTPTDPSTFVAIPLLLAGVVLSACYLPARRAARTEPMAALRCE